MTVCKNCGLGTVSCPKQDGMMFNCSACKQPYYDKKFDTTVCEDGKEINKKKGGKKK